jgi:hypothetical protein
MTKGRAEPPGRVVAEQDPFLIALKSFPDDKRKYGAPMKNNVNGSRSEAVKTSTASVP